MAKLINFVVFFTLVSNVLASECNHRDYGNGATVCVCSDQLKCNGDLNVVISKQNRTITSFTTSKGGARFQSHEYHFADKIPTTAHFNFTVKVNRGKRYQKIIGFGGAFTDATGLNIAKLSKSLQTRLIKDYFDEDGIEYRVCRVPIGGTDFSSRAYSYDDNPDDESLSKFALQQEDFKYKLPYLQIANEVSNHSINFIGTPWSPPAWMKTNKELHHGGFLVGQPGGKYYKLHAEYLVKFLHEYAKNNVTFWGLTVQNEPHMGKNPKSRFNCLGYNSTLQRDFLKLDLGPKLEQSGFGALKVMIFDDNIQEIMEFATTILEDKEAAKFTAGIAFHWYENERSNRSFIDQLAHRFPDQFLLSTEGCEEWNGHQQHVSLGNWATFDRYADDIIKVLNHYSSGWIDWNMALDLEGGPNWVHNFVDAPIIVNETSQEYYKQPFYYALGHFSKFIVPDSVRIENNGENLIDENASILTTLFERPDQSIVLTVLNKNNQSIELQLHDPLHGYLVVNVEANSLQSLIWY